MLYRALQRLSGIADRGDLTALAHLNTEQVNRLILRGAVAPVSAPPLSILPGWTSRAGKLAKVGITDAGAFIEGDSALLERVLRVKPETVERYRASLRELLIVREPTAEF